LFQDLRRDDDDLYVFVRNISLLSREFAVLYFYVAACICISPKTRIHLALHSLQISCFETANARHANFSLDNNYLRTISATKCSGTTDATASHLAHAQPWSEKKHAMTFFYTCNTNRSLKVQ